MCRRLVLCDSRVRYWACMVAIGLGVLVYAQSTYAQRTHAQRTNALIDEVFQCRDSLGYKIFFAGINTGHLYRTEHWGDDSGHIESQSYAGIAGIGTHFSQQTQFVRDEHQGFITQAFTQHISGFKRRDMAVKVSDNGHHSKMTINGESMTFSQSSRPILDADVISAQIRLMLLTQQRSFDLTRQASDMLEHYHYQVKPPQHRDFESLGLIKVIPVHQSGADKVTMWFAPSLNYQLVEAQYHSLLLPGRMTLVDYQRQCN